MACLKVMNADGVLRMIPESPDGNCYGKLPREVIVGVDYDCGATPLDDLRSLVTAEGVMVGNIVKAITTKLGIKQCLACKGRQRQLNIRGLNLQQKIKDLF